MRSVKSPRDGQPSRQIVLPSSLRDMALSRYQNAGGHFGHKKTYRMLATKLFWRKMAQSVKEWCRKCKWCTLIKPPVRRPQVPFSSLSANAPMEILAIDFTVLEPSQGGYENVLVITDVFNKYTWAVPTKDQCAVTVARVLVKHVFIPYGCNYTQTKEDSLRDMY